MSTKIDPVHVIGGGLAGSEAAWQIAQAGVPVILHEMRPVRGTDAHHTDGLAELVCSNSFRADDWTANAVGLLHAEMRRLDSIIMSCGDAHQVPAGGALAVDRDGFSQAVTARLEAHPNVTIAREEIAGLPPPEWDSVIVATGPLTSPALSEAILSLTGEGELSFFDAIAPIVNFDSIDMGVAWRQSRYDKEGPGGDAAAYINCPLDKDQYEAFIDALLQGPKAEFKEWEDVPYFDGCLPIEVMAERGRETLRHGPMKPVGLTNEHNPQEKAYAIVQLRQDNALGTLWNMVGFQTKLKHGAQTDIFRTIPGLEKAVFARLGGLHRNTFLNSPKLLDAQLRLKLQPRLRFAGQVTGVEGYVESAAMGLLAGRLAAAERLGAPIEAPPATTALGALVGHITGGHLEGGKGSFQPMNINYGLLPPVEAVAKRDEAGRRLGAKEKSRGKKLAVGERALADLETWVTGGAKIAAE
ncbi:MAG: methylenetetrahydrofolate--tRNA-(uracil(54)-C(5))-methyltransferase (FADH(2)-oxidizing) TrmFO [Phenylobacterium sp.]|uniref:methylenetetrahydrofolate--tRNA-(uracil(54)- C(5))-methyltransferase (FADH(2)-oxidizing) TrmFO n=1 Tax=Phenylobacterium sp. TaxID=1871053 RepID=UPI001B5E1908|nr:methylenetetrahydrofolate--tRNA-(uracil(54)-C(5))-methyltransferase (FADH(2)-oxidizing) TrmFO [Phenylobacterium sp.]MBP7650370.1 methylenetetrahydrofolate--tRNA-(uracil(54)-C(5))-methyltransferase (FADH(2)-oxidizing) TrmFO [Phenylobacterium sp.]MBP7816019.1 methylenetetrahydrofolate--tRNA-(uracil(54)-C(5))-methyltransferase (FADH(2)-oxidizing) TrmFO [Phenylobacterium sp.]MBP9231077.1 methylenetetrahydrofolate--tRNA-(uracil(54)-C(5))-methyltransferase (FADH(2)-oxidizing) TrmFO [Phenylobacteriu